MVTLILLVTYVFFPLGVKDEVSRGVGDLVSDDCYGHVAVLHDLHTHAYACMACKHCVLLYYIIL